MNTLRRIIPAGAIVLLALPLWADEGPGPKLTDERFRFHGEVRARAEAQDNYQDFNDDGGFFDPFLGVSFEDDTAESFPYRVRLALEGEVVENLFYQVEIQNGDRFGDNADQKGIHETGSDDDLDLYTGFIHWNRLGGTDWNLRIGRQEMRIGNELLFGDFDYYNGQSFDGWRLHWDGDPVEFQFWWANTNETLFADADTDIFMFSIDGAVERGDSWSFYGSWIVEDGISGIDRQTLLVVGGRWTRWEGEENHLLWNMEIAYQDGRVGNQQAVINDITRPDFGAATGETGDDTFITAWGAEGAFGYGWVGSESSHKVYAHVYFATGDENPSDNDDKSFRPLFQDYHERLGRADIVQGTNVLSYGVAWEGTFGEKHAAGADAMVFQIHQPDSAPTCMALTPGNFQLNPRSLRMDCFLDPAGDAYQGLYIPAGNLLSGSMYDPDEDDLGQELDLWYDYYITEKLSLNVELSMFFPGDAIDQLRNADEFAAVAPDTSALLSSVPTERLAGQTQFLLADDQVTRLAAQIRLRF